VAVHGDRYRQPRRTTEVADRRDPMLPAAAAVLAARRALAAGGGARHRRPAGATPGGTNVIASSVDFWLDARAPLGSDTRAVVEEITEAARAAAVEEGCALAVRQESFGDTVLFRRGPAGPVGGRARRRSGAADRRRARRRHPGRPGADRDAVRAQPDRDQPRPAEHAEPADCETGAAGAGHVLESLAGSPS